MQIDKAWKITEFAKLVEKHYNTVDQWFKQLEDKRIHYVNRVAGEKVYDEIDLEIGRYIKEARDKQFNLQIIFEQLPDLYDMRSFPEDWSTGDSLVDLEGIRREMEQKFEIKFQEAKEELLQMATDAAAAQMRLEMQRQLPKPLTEEERRVADEKESEKIRKKVHEELTYERSNEMLTKRKIENKLEDEAINAWNALPESERMKKAGLFRKEVDRDKREDFIRKYIRNNYEKAVKDEYDMK